jgi:hypothetical protein
VRTSRSAEPNENLAGVIAQRELAVGDPEGSGVLKRAGEGRFELFALPWLQPVLALIRSSVPKRSVGGGPSGSVTNPWAARIHC